MSTLIAPERPITRRTLLGAGLALTALLAACGTDEAREAAGGGDDAYPRTVTDGAGVDVVIPTRPRRIACGQNVWDLDAVLALGVAPVQMGLRDFAEYTGSPTVSWPWHEQALRGLGDAGADVQRLPVGEEPDIEAIAASRPDLIIGDTFIGDARDTLTPLAPVLQVASFDWRQNLRIVGDALDLRAEADELIEQTDRTIAAALADRDLAGATVGVFAVYDTTAFYVFGDATIPTVDLFQRAGFGLVEDLVAAATPEEPRVEYSIEEIGRLAPADVLLVVDYSAGAAASTELAGLSLYAQLPAVQAGRVVVVPQGELAQGLSVFGPLNVQLGLDLVTRAADTLA